MSPERRPARRWLPDLTVDALCAIQRAAWHIWQGLVGGLEGPRSERIRELEAENAKLRRGWETWRRQTPSVLYGDADDSEEVP